METVESTPVRPLAGQPRMLTERGLIVAVDGGSEEDSSEPTVPFVFASLFSE